MISVGTDLIIQAHLFPVIAGESMSNVYRISVTLKEEINPELLQRALDMVLPKFDGFNLRLRQGCSGIIFGGKRKSGAKGSHGEQFSMQIYPAE